MKRYLPLLCLPVGLLLVAACSSSSDNKANTSSSSSGGASSGDPGTAGGTNTDGGSQPGTSDPTTNPIDGLKAADKWSSDSINILSSFLDGPTWSNKVNSYFLSAPEQNEGFVFILDETGLVGPTRQAPDPNRTVGQAVDPASGDIFSVVKGAIQRTPVPANKITDPASVKTVCTAYDPATNPPSTDPFDPTKVAPPGTGAFHSLNDLVISQKGNIYFTDPGFGDDTAEANRVFVVPAAGGTAKIVAAYQNGETPNGIALSPDEKSLYVSFTKNFNSPPAIMKFVVGDDGAIDNKQAPTVFAQLDPKEVVDGLATDTAGNVYAALSQSVAVYKADGSGLWGSLPVAVPSGDTVVGMTFGGPNLTELFIVTGGASGSGGVFRANVKVKGNPQ